ncbi:MAG: hypothetical protein H5T61_09555 [Thermoflexales bacterium]|nr:hypothetical protein [Thermoflexales bacterium]
MTTIVKSLGDFVNLVAQTFNLSTLFPAFVFIALLQMFLLPLLPADSPFQALALTNDDGWPVALNLILVALLAYLLDAANISLIRLFEGYPLRRCFPFDWLEERHRSYVRSVLNEIERLRKEYWEAFERDEARAEDIAIRLDDCLKRLANRYPEDLIRVLPTPFGNVIAAAEYYPMKILGMDAVALWPFLRPIMNETGYAAFVLRDKAVMDFLVNLVTILSAFGVLYGGVNWFYRGWQVSWIGVVFLIGLCCFLLYLLSVQAAAGWGITIRTPFVLYREHLRQRLRLRLAVGYEEERCLWEEASAFFSGEMPYEDLRKLGDSIFGSTDGWENLDSGGQNGKETARHA